MHIKVRLYYIFSGSINESSLFLDQTQHIIIDFPFSSTVSINTGHDWLPHFMDQTVIRITFTISWFKLNTKLLLDIMLWLMMLCKWCCAILYRIIKLNWLHFIILFRFSATALALLLIIIVPLKFPYTFQKWNL